MTPSKEHISHLGQAFCRQVPVWTEDGAGDGLGASPCIAVRRLLARGTPAGLLCPGLVFEVHGTWAHEGHERLPQRRNVPFLPPPGLDVGRVGTGLTPICRTYVLLVQYATLPWPQSGFFPPEVL